MAASIETDKKLAIRAVWIHGASHANGAAYILVSRKLGICFWPDPPAPVPVGSPVCAMKPGIAVKNDAIIIATLHEFLDAVTISRKGA